MRRVLLLLTALVVVAAPAEAPAALPGVAEEARKAGLARIAADVEAAALPALRMTRRVGARMPAALGTTRLGGVPDLPPGVRWPRCKGAPMAFLGQVRLDALPASELPRSGLLSVFTQVETESPGDDYGVWAGDCAKVLHTPAGAVLQRRVADPRRYALRHATVRFGWEAVLRPLTFEGELVTPTRTVDLSEADLRRYQRLEERLAPAAFDRDVGQWEARHRLLGHPLWGQEDPGRICAGEDGRPADWRLLLQLAYDPQLGWEVADGGMLHLMIRADDLRRGDLTKPCPSFESS